MHASRGLTLPVRLQTLAVTAALFERLERDRRGASPEQFQSVARQLSGLLAQAEPAPGIALARALDRVGREKLASSIDTALDETWSFMQALHQLGGPTWFKLGDSDLATHVERTRRLAAGETWDDAMFDAIAPPDLKNGTLR